MNPVQELLQFLDQSGPGQYVVITGELAKIFPPPLRFKYADYAADIRSFLYEIERERLIRLDIPKRELFESTFGDLNNVFYNLESHEVKATITKEGSDYLARAAIRRAPLVAIGPIIVNSPGANSVHSSGTGSITIDSRSGNATAEPKRKRSKIVGFLKAVADSIASLQKISLMVSLLLGFWGARLVLPKPKAQPPAAPAKAANSIDTPFGKKKAEEKILGQSR